MIIEIEIARANIEIEIARANIVYFGTVIFTTEQLSDLAIREAAAGYYFDQEKNALMLKLNDENGGKNAKKSIHPIGCNRPDSIRRPSAPWLAGFLSLFGSNRRSAAEKNGR